MATPYHTEIQDIFISARNARPQSNRSDLFAVKVIKILCWLHQIKTWYLFHTCWPMFQARNWSWLCRIMETLPFVEDGSDASPIHQWNKSWAKGPDWRRYERDTSLLTRNMIRMLQYRQSWSICCKYLLLFHREYGRFDQQRFIFLYGHIYECHVKSLPLAIILPLKIGNIGYKHNFIFIYKHIYYCYTIYFYMCGYISLQDTPSNYLRYLGNHDRHWKSALNDSQNNQLRWLIYHKNR